MLDVDLEVVLEVLPDARQVVTRVDADRAQLPGVTDPGQLQQLRRVERAATQDHLTGRTRSWRRPGRVYSTPVTRSPSMTSRVTIARVTTSRLGRRSTGRR